MRPVLECAAKGEVRIGDVVEQLADRFHLTEAERTELLPSGKQARFANRVHWAKSYLKQAGLVKTTKWGYFSITDRGKAALADKGTEINNAYLEKFDEFQNFRARTKDTRQADVPVESSVDETGATPDELLRSAHRKINAALAEELLDRVRGASPAFFERVIIELLLAMGYGGTSEEAGRALGRTGDDGVDGVIGNYPVDVPLLT